MVMSGHIRFVTMASATWNESVMLNILKEADLKEYEEICLRKGLKKVKHLKDINSLLLQQELGIELLCICFCRESGHFVS